MEGGDAAPKRRRFLGDFVELNVSGQPRQTQWSTLSSEPCTYFERMLSEIKEGVWPTDEQVSDSSSSFLGVPRGAALS